MRPELERFFRSMERYFADTGTLDALFEAHPLWSADRARVAIYGAFVDGHVEEILDKLYPHSRAASGDAWPKLVRGYRRTRPARHFEMNQLGSSFPAFVANVAHSLSLPPFLPALARFEWTDWEVYASEQEVPVSVSEPAVNPTLVALEHGWKLCPWISSADRPAAPEAGNEMALLWRHPRKLRTMFVAADERALLVLKVALERIPLERAAAESALALAEVERLWRVFTADGLVLSPSSGS